MRSSTRFQLLRSFLLVAIFLVLFTLTQQYLLEPYFQPHRTAAYQQQQQEQLKQHIRANICPPGQECEYNLKEEYRG